MNQVQILRLRNGEDIIANVEIYSANGNFGVSNPMHVSVDYAGNQSNLVLSHWLPVQLIKFNQTVIKQDAVIAQVEPNDEFAEYYTNAVEKIQNALRAKSLVNDMDDNQVLEVMEALKELSSSGGLLH